MSNEKKAPKRRKQTKGEKEALRLRKLREKFGSSPVDPDEPNFSEGIPREAIRCAYTDARQTHSKPDQQFNPAVVASRTTTTIGLNSQQKGELKNWLVWLKDRRYVTRDPYTSPVLQWALSGEGPDVWTGDTAPWHARVDRDHAKRQVAKSIKSSANAPTLNSHAPGTVVGAPIQPSWSATDGSVHPSGQADAERYHPVSSNSSSSVHRPAFNRPAFPKNAFASGMAKANAFSEALRDKSDEALRQAATALSADAHALSEAISRNPEFSRCIETVFRHFDLPFSGSKP